MEFENIIRKFRSDSNTEEAEEKVTITAGQISEAELIAHKDRVRSVCREKFA